jgi:hypothetical protein
MDKQLKLRCAYPAQIRTVYGTGEIIMDRDTGKPTYVIGIKVRAEGEDKADIIDLQVVGEPVGIEEDDPVAVEGLSARFWERDGRAGMTYRAVSIRKADEASKPAETASGTAPTQGAARTGKTGGTS